MCGIGAFSLAPGSTIKPKQLGNALLAELESRGYMTAGFAAYGGDNNQHYGMDKGPGLGSRMSLKSMPRDAHSAIFHTRYATKGSIYDNTNNHPVVTPAGRITLVHNGVIRNDGHIRSKVLSNSAGLAEVDTIVIPALLEEQGTDGIKELSGDAAVAYFDSEQPAIVNLIRIEHSPMALAYLTDGSKVMASTVGLLEAALTRIGLVRSTGKQGEDDFVANDYEVYNLTELSHQRWDRGTILESATVPKPEGKGGYGSTMRGATAGGTGSVSVSSGYGSARNRGGTGSYGRGLTREQQLESYYSEYGIPRTLDDWDDDTWDDYGFAARPVSSTYSGFNSDNSEFYDVWGMSDVKVASARFYTEDFEGNKVYYRSAFDLKETLEELLLRTGDKLRQDDLFEQMDAEYAETLSPLAAVYLDLGHVGTTSGEEFSWGERPDRAYSYGTGTGGIVLALVHTLNAIFYGGNANVKQAQSKSTQESTAEAVNRHLKMLGEAGKAAQEANTNFVQFIAPGEASDSDAATCDIPQSTPMIIDNRPVGFDKPDEDDERPMIRYVEATNQLSNRINGVFASFNMSTRKMDVDQYAKARDMVLQWAENAIEVAQGEQGLQFDPRKSSDDILQSVLSQK